MTDLLPGHVCTLAQGANKQLQPTVHYSVFVNNNSEIRHPQPDPPYRNTTVTCTYCLYIDLQPTPQQFGWTL